MRRFFFYFLGAGAFLALIFASHFAYVNLRGIGPAVLPIPGDASYITSSLSVPPGFSISIFAKGLGDPRVMAQGFAGGLLVSIPSQGKVVALPDRNGDGKADQVITVIEGLNHPHGLAFRCPPQDSDEADCRLYIAETNQVAAYTYDQNTFKATFEKKIVDLPDGGNHVTRTIMFFPPLEAENLMLISVGSSCNVCNEKDPLRAKILVVDVDDPNPPSTLTTYASGLRNSVFMASHPMTNAVWATEMGRDLLGDNIPPDEINIIDNPSRQSDVNTNFSPKNFGWPNCYGKNIHDTEFDHNTYIRNPCMEPFETPSYIDIPAHSAPLGLAFFPAVTPFGGDIISPQDQEESWPKEYWNNLLVAFHGSWNRSIPTGYKIVRYKLDDQGKVLGPPEDFITGWLAPSKVEGSKDSKVLGRPVDILIGSNRTMYISDDKAGVIYRLTYHTVNNASEKTNSIQLASPKPNELIKSPLTITGKAQNYWFFEASFPVKLEDANGKEIAATPAHAQGDWMTQDFVPFSATLTFAAPETDTGTLVLQKDNPSGNPQNADALAIPVRFK